MTLPSHFDPSDIALHSAWMRRLARGLLGDDASADDVVQEAWAKLGSGRRTSYLAAVVRSFALRWRRSEGRRARRERAAARDEALPSAHEVAARSELARSLAEAVERLAEPYRTTLVLRYYDDLSAAEIARRAGIPPATVRARLKRGLDALRARLDHRDGGRERWVSALLPLARPRIVALGSFAVALLATKLALASVLALSVVVLVWRAVARDPGADGRVTEQAPSLRSALTSAAGAPLQGAQETSRREARVDRSSASSPDAAGPAAGVVHARVVDESGAPVPGAWLRLRRAPENAAQCDGSGEMTLRVEAGEIERLAALDPARLLALEVGAHGRRTRLFSLVVPAGDAALELGEVVLAPGGVVCGRVLDERGHVVEGALVAFGLPVERRANGPDPALRGPDDLDADRTSWKSLDPALVGASGPGGEFCLEGVSPGYGTAWARTATSLWAYSEPIGVQAGEEVRGIELVVKESPERTLSGSVVDPEGRPVPGLELRFSASDQEDGWWNVVTDARGGFHFVPLDGAPQDINARSPSWEWEDLDERGVAAGTHELVLTFELSQWLQIAVRDSAGASVGNGRVVGLPGDSSGNALPRCESPLDASGRARLRRPSAPLRVRVAAPGFACAILGPFDPALFPRPLEVTLEPVPALSGRVLLADGRPAAGATVSLHRAAGVRASTLHPGACAFLTHPSWDGDRDPCVTARIVEPVARVTADAQGRFRLPLPVVVARTRNGLDELGELGYGDGQSESAPRAEPETSWYVHAAMDGAATITSGPHVFDGGRDVTLDLRLPLGGSLAGTLVLPSGRSRAGWTAVASDGLAQAAETTVRADGAFVLHHLHAGGWQVRVFEPGQRFHASGGRMCTVRAPVPDVEVVAGSTVAYEHRTEVRASARLLGSLRIDGEPAGPWRVSVRTATPQAAIQSYSTTLDPQGSFEITLEPGLKTSLEISRTFDGATLAVRAQPVILPGANAWSCEFASARRAGSIAGHPSAERTFGGPTYEVQCGEATITATWTPDGEGRFGPLPVPAGHGVLRGPRPLDFRQRPPAWAELDLAPGETRRIEPSPR